MKKINIIILASALLAGGLTTSCNLDREPKSSLDIDRALLTLEDAKAWQAGLKARLRASVNGAHYLAQDIQVDELTATMDYGNNYGAFADWSKFQSGEYTSRDIYAFHYSTIKNANYVIEYLPKLLETTTTFSATDRSTLEAILGEAYFSRAYSYLNLALRFGKAYTEATAGTDLSVSIHTKYDYKAIPPRSTNKEVYELVLADLTEASTKLAGVAGKANSDAITIDAVKALQARTYLYMGKWAEALAKANELIGSSAYALMPAGPANMLAMWQADGTNLKESILQPNVSFPDEGVNTSISAYLAPTAATNSFTPLYLPTKGVYDLFEAGDTRKDVYFWAGETLSISGTTFNSVVMVGKWRGNPSLGSTAHSRWVSVPDGRMRPKLFRIAEQYLIAAEAAFRTGGDALTPLNALRASRGLSTLSGISGDALLREIKLERQRELAFEGFRLFDLKRWGENVVRANPQVPTESGQLILDALATVTYNAGDNKFVWPIPHQDVQVGKLVQNPGY